MPAAKGTIPWNAGTSEGWTDKRGYRWIYVTENGRRVARREHRALMEAHLGRKLEPWELVHHRDGNPRNNDLANLELVEWGVHTTEHHTGGRKSEDARRSMEAFALMREQLKREREIKADLLDALCEAENLACIGDIVESDDPREFGGWGVWLKQARAAIAKVTSTELRQATP